MNGSSASPRHYGNRLQSWDVCNESATDYGMGRLIPGDRICRSHYGPMPGDYAFFSFKCAEKAFPPEVNLNINDYQYGFNNAYGRQVADMLARGAKIDIVGSQMHLFNPTESVRIAAGEVRRYLPRKPRNAATPSLSACPCRRNRLLRRPYRRGKARK